MKALPFTGQHCSQLRDQLYFHLELHGLRLRELGNKSLHLWTLGFLPFPYLPTGCLACLPQHLAPY